MDSTFAIGIFCVFFLVVFSSFFNLFFYSLVSDVISNSLSSYLDLIGLHLCNIKDVRYFFLFVSILKVIGNVRKPFEAVCLSVWFYFGKNYELVIWCIFVSTTTNMSFYCVLWFVSHFIISRCGWICFSNFVNYADWAKPSYRFNSQSLEALWASSSAWV